MADPLLVQTDDYESKTVQPTKSSKWREYTRFEPHLVPLKTLYFTIHVSLAAEIPFFPQFCQRIGLRVDQMGFINGMMPLVGFFTRPAIGYLCDRSHRHRLIMGLCAIIAAVCLYLHIIVIDNDCICSTPVLLDSLTCSNNSSFTVCSNNTILRDSAMKGTQVALQIDDQQFNLIADIKNNCASFSGTCPGNFYKNETVKISQGCPVCSNYSPKDTFLIILLLRILGYVCFAPLLPTADSFAHELSTNRPGLWGRQRVWSTFGWGLGALSLGYTLSYVGFKVLFIIGGTCMILGAMVLPFMKKTTKSDSDSRNELRMLMKNPCVLIFLFFCMLNGAFLAIEFNYLFWYLSEMVPDEVNKLVGFHQFTDCFVEFPFFFFCDQIISRVGHVNILCFSFLTYVVRLISYSFLTKTTVWWVLAVESMHGLSLTMFVASASAYSELIAPKGLSTSLQNMYAAMHFGLGLALGDILGGLAYKMYGPVVLFRICAVLSLICAISYWLLYTCWLKRYEREFADDSDMTIPAILVDESPEDEFSVKGWRSYTPPPSPPPPLWAGLRYGDMGSL